MHIYPLRLPDPRSVEATSTMHDGYGREMATSSSDDDDEADISAEE